MAFAIVVVSSLLALGWARSRPVTETAFADFAGGLAPVAAPAGAWSVYLPDDTSQWGGTPSASWNSLGNGVFVSWADPRWWVAINGWTTVAGPNDGPRTCREVEDWVQASGSTLGLAATTNTSDALEQCLSTFALVSATPAGTMTSDTLGGRGTQTSDGTPRYRTGGVIENTGERGQVVVRLVAEASVANR